MLSLPGLPSSFSSGSKVIANYSPGVQFVQVKTYRQNVMKTVLVIYTGGTIGMIETEEGEAFIIVSERLF